MAKHTVFVENDDGVHIENGEFTLCGDAYDGNTWAGDEDFATRPSVSRVVTCPNCADIIDMCRGVRVAPNLKRK